MLCHHDNTKQNGIQILKNIHDNALTSCAVDFSNEVDAADDRSMLAVLLLLTTTSRRLLVGARELKASVVDVRTPTSRTTATLEMRTIDYMQCLFVDLLLEWIRQHLSLRSYASNDDER